MQNNTFKIKVNNTFEFELNQEDAEKLDLIPAGQGKYHLINQNKSQQLEITQSKFLKKEYDVVVNGNQYNVVINNSLDQLIKELGFEVGAAKAITSLNSPMPGLILEVNVKEGDEVKEGDTLLILEAMKMENVLSSPRDGVIKAVSVSQGDAIEKNQLLLEFE